MLLDLFTYFAKFPASAGITRGIATKGESSMEEYATVLGELSNMQEKELVPEIENYVYGQSFDELKQRIDKLTGSFLFVDYGEVDMQSDGRRSFECTQRIAVTVAMKLPNTSDMLERIIANDRTLQMLSKIHARIMADAEREELYWMNRDSVANSEIIPFVSAELQSYGWTLMLSGTGADILDTHRIARKMMKG
ncbi:MAG: hypothetical protein UDO44_04190 [Prevotella sp.]|nr:hypothetical protein [Prevotella sp.]